MSALAIWMNGVYVGQWQRAGRLPAVLRYDDAWVNSVTGRPLSLSLPFTSTEAQISGDVVTHYFENLLPDNPTILSRMAARFQATSTDAFSLLEKIGRDAAGAVQLLPVGLEPSTVFQVDARPLSEAQVADYLRRTLRTGSDALFESEFRFSLAGAQEKTALLFHEGQWCLPENATPTTHILKLPLGLVGNHRYDLSHSVENEWLCMHLLKELGLLVANVEMALFEDQKVLVVERFDRRWNDNGWWMRIPHEDILQAHGLPSHLKYESDGGPGIDSIMRLLESSSHSQANQETFFKSLLVFWLMAAIDGHAKNFSLEIGPRGAFRLAPLYDVLSAWPWEGKGAQQLHLRDMKMAMALRTKNTHYHLFTIYRRHWLEIGTKYLGEALTEQLLEDVPVQLQRVLDELGQRLPDGFPLVLFERVSHGVERQIARLKLG